MRSALAFMLSSALLGLGGCSSSHGGPPQPSGVGGPVGSPHKLLIDAVTGGQIVATALAGTATITVTVPPGALAVPTEITVTEISNTAPGGVGSAWRIGPEGLQFITPVTLAFKPGVPVDTLGVSTQANGGYWLRRRDVTRDTVAGAVSVSTDHLSDWAVTTGSSARDLQGTVSIASTVDIPSTVTGSMTLDYAGDSGDSSYYILGGTLVAPNPVVDGTTTCVPGQPSFAVRANLAELHPTAFVWGTSGFWPMSCTGPSGGSSQTLTVAFDNGGFSYVGCARGDLVPPVVTATEVKGQYRIDCGTRGTVAATWDFVTCSPGATCTPATSCRTGAVSCAAAMPSCVENGNQPDGSACGTQPGDACQAGACVICSPTATCTPTDPCRTGTVSCTTSPSSCVAAGNMPDGTHCGTQAADQCVAGICSACTVGAACGTPTICQTSATVCTTSPATCSVQNKPDGTSCGTQVADVCTAGACSLCTPGGACGAPTTCQTSAAVCTTSPATCSIQNKPDGAACGTQVADVCAAGACAICPAGAACGAPTSCQTSATVCTTSPATCSIQNKPDGTSCGPQAADTCSGGNCSTCTAGAPCGSPTVCQTSATDCTTSPSTCSIQNMLDGTSCGPQAADTCSGGACLLCVPGAACGAPTECQTSATDCTTNPSTCTIQNKLDGTACSIGVCTAGVCG